MPKVSSPSGPALCALLGVGLFLLAWAAGMPAQAGVADQTAQALRARIGPPHEETIKAYVEAGASDTKAHVLTEREWTLVEAAIADLPLLYRRTLERRLAKLSFIDAPSSTGTALTRAVEGPDGEVMFDITLRAEVLEKSLSDFLTGKEAMLFSPDGSGYRVQVKTSEASALAYILLHETAHVMDRTLDITMAGGPFKSVWADYRTLAQPLAEAPVARSVYRRGPKLPLSQSPQLYRALAGAPFVSLYATASAGEDFAELLAWRELSSRFSTPLAIEVLDAHGDVVVLVEPLKSPTVQSRLQAAEASLAEAIAAKPDKI